MSDKKYREYISTLPSCLSGRFSEYVHGTGRNVACHVRRASNSGTAYKPEYSCVPMTDEEHRYQHLLGEWAAISKFGNAMTYIRTKEEAKEFFDNRVELYLKMWERHDAKI